MSIHFFNEGVAFKLKARRKLKSWIGDILNNEGKQIGEINFIFASDDYILELNRKYLNHDYFTDIVTFNYNNAEIVNGDIYISVDTVRSNAAFYEIQFIDEIYRVIIHGILHLIGFDDKTKHQQTIMRFEENKSLEMLRLNYL